MSMFSRLLLLSCLVYVPKSIFSCGFNYGNTGRHKWLSKVEAQSRVINGSEAVDDEFPWMVLFEHQRGERWLPFCGGTIVSSTLVLTALHCLNNIVDYPVRLVAGCRRVGQKGCQIRRVNHSNGFWPPRVNDGRNDIALISLAHDPWKITSKKGNSVGAICLPRQDVEFQGLAVVAGWGQTEKSRSSADLLVVDLNILPARHCEYRLQPTLDGKVISSGILNFNPIKELCTGYIRGSRASCFGDSGGPLMVTKGHRIYQVGVVAYGPDMCGSSGGRDSLPVFTKVSAFRGWIDEVVDEMMAKVT